jgi:hypothetical protein
MRCLLAGAGPSVALLILLAIAGLVRFPNP